MTKKIKIFTDGSSLGNPGPGGYGVVIKILSTESKLTDNANVKKIKGEKTIELSGGEPDTTNNRMEMRAMIEALNWLKTNLKKSLSIELYSDSQLLINSLNLNWKRKKNLDLWHELDQARKDLQIKYTWLKGHAGHPENERCDQLARQQAKKIARLPANKTTPARISGKKIQTSFF